VVRSSSAKWKFTALTAVQLPHAGTAMTPPNPCPMKKPPDMPMCARPCSWGQRGQMTLCAGHHWCQLTRQAAHVNASGYWRGRGCHSGMKSYGLCLGTPQAEEQEAHAPLDVAFWQRVKSGADHFIMAYCTRCLLMRLL
jgi:hypothetical protein